MASLGFLETHPRRRSRAWRGTTLPPAGTTRPGCRASATPATGRTSPGRWRSGRAGGRRGAGGAGGAAVRRARGGCARRSAQPRLTLPSRRYYERDLAALRAAMSEAALAAAWAAGQALTLEQAIAEALADRDARASDADVASPPVDRAPAPAQPPSPMPPTNLYEPLTSFVGREARAGRGRPAAGRRPRLLTLTGAGGVRQDAAGARGRRGRRWPTIPTASGWSSWRRWPTRRSCRRRWRARWASPSSPAGRSTETLAALRWPQAAAAGAGQLRAPGRRVRRAWPRRCCAPAPTLRVLATSREPLGDRRRDRPGACPRWRCPTPAAAGRRRALAGVRGGAALRRAGGGGAAGLRADRRQRGGGGRDLPPAGRHPAGDRAGGGARAGAVGRADRGAAGRRASGC